MRAPGLVFAQRLGFVERDGAAQLAQPFGQAGVALPSRSLQAGDVSPKGFVRGRVEEVAEDVDGGSGKAGAELDAADEFEVDGPGALDCVVVAFQRVVVGDAQRPNPIPLRQLDQPLRTQSPVRAIRVAVKIDHS